MQVNVAEFIKDAEIEEKLYPGKRLVKKCPQAGTYKSHCVVLDWRAPESLKVSVKAGQSGRDVPDELLKNYPVSLQTPTYMTIAIDGQLAAAQEEDEDDGDEGEESRGRAGKGGDKGARKKRKADSALSGMAEAFSRVIEDTIPETGRVAEMVIMGMKVGESAYERVFEVMTHQIAKGKIAATDLLAEAGKFVTRYTPPSFMKPKGNEDAVYRYDRDKIGPMFGASGPS